MSISTKGTEKLIYWGPFKGFENLFYLRKKLIFFATLASTERFVCVKFVRSYSREVHEILLEMGVAYVPLDDDEQRSKRGHLYNIIKSKIMQLHQKGYVHGDLRDVNVVVKQDSVDDSFLLFDFDWSGVIGKASQFIKPEHDMMMLDKMFEGQD
ncbi:hypothetical protein AX15_005864 [Amanita polypyramis BW_CC]|nr:hypothetical protein AX15_005864 [Amanita polypyramis BW_CC]